MKRLIATAGILAACALMAGCFAIVVSREIHHHGGEDGEKVTTEESHVEMMCPSEVIAEVAEP